MTKYQNEIIISGFMKSLECCYDDFCDYINIYEMRELESGADKEQVKSAVLFMKQYAIPIKKMYDKYNKYITNNYFDFEYWDFKEENKNLRTHIKFINTLVLNEEQSIRERINFDIENILLRLNTKVWDAFVEIYYNKEN